MIKRKFGHFKKEWIYSAVIVVVGFCYYMTYFNYGISLHDEGIFVYGAQRVLQGQMPMSDFISYPPGSYFLLATLFKIFGINLLVSRVMEIAFLLLNGVMLFCIGKRLMPKSMALIPSFILIAIPGPWHKVFFAFGLLLPLVALFRFLEKRTTGRIVAVGGAIGMAVIFKFESALYSLLTALIILFWIRIWKNGKFLIDRKAISDSFKDVFLCGLGSFVIIIPVLMYYFWKSSLMKLFSALGEFYEVSNLGSAITYYGQPSLLRAVSKFDIGSLQHLFFYLILLFYLYMVGKIVIHLFIEKEKDLPLSIPILVMGMFSLTYAYAVFDKAHLLQSATMAYILFGYVIYTLLQRKGAKSRVAIIVLLLLLGLYVVYNFSWRRGQFYSGSISRLYAVRKEGVRTLSTSKGRIYLEENQSETVCGFIQFFKGKEGYLMPVFEPMVNFLTGLDNPTWYSFLFPTFINDPSRQRRVIGDLERYQIKYLLIIKKIWIDEKGFASYAPILYEYIMKHYQSETEIGEYLILSQRRKDA